MNTLPVLIAYLRSLWDYLRAFFGSAEENQLLFPDTIDLIIDQRHIDTGLRSDCHSCPVALSLSEQFGPHCHISVGGVGVIVRRFSPGIKSTPTTCFYKIPETLRRWISDYDFGLQVFPDTFTLRCDE